MKSIPLEDVEKIELFDNNNINKISITKQIETDKGIIKTKYLFSSENKNFIYYSCYKKNITVKVQQKLIKKIKILL